MNEVPFAVPSRGVAVALLVLRLLLALFFAFMAGRNLSGDAALAADFARWGYADWFRQLTAWLQLAGAAALLFPPLVFAGALLLSGVLVGAIVTHLLHDPPATALSPLLFLALLLPLLVGSRPALLR